MVGEQSFVAEASGLSAKVPLPGAEGPSPSGLTGGWGRSARMNHEVRSMQRRQPPILVGHDGAWDEYDGKSLMNEVYDLMRRRLPRIGASDRYRPVLSWFLAELGRRLGRPELVPVPEDREATQD